MPHPSCQHPHKKIQKPLYPSSPDLASTHPNQL
jgi:hypothetical protein